MDIDSEYSKISQDDLIIKILEFVCGNKYKKIFPSHIRNIFPELDLNDITNLFNEIQVKKIPQISFYRSAGKPSIRYRDGLEEYVKRFKQMKKREKLHRIVEFLSTENDRMKKSCFDSGEIAKAFSPELDIYEVNTLCKTIINNGDLRDCTTKDESSKRMIAVMVITATHEAYHTKKYLEEDEQFSIPIKQNITGDNIIIGDVSGTVTQEDHSTITTTKASGKQKWLKWLYWTIGILVGLTALYIFIKSQF